jgi:ABC-type Fe3+ transport system substrate-binding protein
VAHDSRGYPFNNFAPFWGMERTLEVTKAIGANSPVLLRGSPSIAAAVVSGEVPIGISTVGTIEQQKASGAPVDWFAPDEIPIDFEFAIVPKGAPNVNTARLWAAWITTEGRPQFEQLEKNGLAWPGEDSLLSRRLAQLGTKFSFSTTRQDAEISAQALKLIGEAYLAR